MTRSSEYEKPPNITKEMSDEIDENTKKPGKEYKNVLKAPILNKPAKTKFKSEDIFIEQQRLKK